MKREKSCGCIVVDGGMVLLIGTKDEEGRIYYGFPKGHQEHNETNIETALRETKEEVGIDAEIIDELPIKTGHFVRDGDAWKDIYFFLAKPINGEIKRQEDEIEVAVWVNFEEAERLLKIMGYYLDVWYKAIKRISK